MRRCGSLKYLLVLVFAASSVCGAQGNPTGAPTTYFGAVDCGEWIRNPNATKKAWLMGYLSGLNKMYTLNRDIPKDPLGALRSGDQALLWMDNFCQRNPLEMVATGAMELFVELMARK